MESPFAGLEPMPDGDSPCQIFLDRLEDLGLQIDRLLQDLEAVDQAYQNCTQKGASAEMRAAGRRFETLARIGRAAKAAIRR